MKKVNKLIVSLFVLVLGIMVFIPFSQCQALTVREDAAIEQQLSGMVQRIRAVEASTEDKELQEQIDRLKERLQLLLQIAELEELLKDIEFSDLPRDEWCYEFENDLRIGDTHRDVAYLHRALSKEGFRAPAFGEMDSFIKLTASAVVGFQEKYSEDILDPLNLPRGTGFVGSLTRAKLNELYRCKPTPVPPTPLVNITSPKRGESLTKGKMHTISWESSGVPEPLIYPRPKNTVITLTPALGDDQVGPVPLPDVPEGELRDALDQIDTEDTLMLSKDMRRIVLPEYVITSGTQNTGRYRWNVGEDEDGRNIPIGRYMLRVRVGNYSDTVIFYIGHDGIVDCPDIAPECGDTLLHCQLSALMLELSYPGCKYSHLCDGCEYTRSITVTYPNGNEVLATGETHDIRWSSPTLGDGKRVQIGLWDTRLCSETGGEQIIANTTNTGRYSWAIPSQLNGLTLGGEDVYVVKLYYDGGGPGKFDQSDDYFSIVKSTECRTDRGCVWCGDSCLPRGHGQECLAVLPPADYECVCVDGICTKRKIDVSSITVISPNGGETWLMGNAYRIRWDHEGVRRVDIEIAFGSDSGQRTTIAEGVVAGNGAYAWTVPSNHINIPPGDFYKIIITDSYDSSVLDMSNNFFKILRKDEEECRTDRDCMWCGTSCIPRQTGIECPMIAPAPGSECVCQGGKCIAILADWPMPGPIEREVENDELKRIRELLERIMRELQ